ncbi:lipoprotein 17-related variable surface protein [Ureaplasma miroungigenitalium]|uniref:lipoprotein 17-related variable surface protein n=1 Tax=Ureaplasma miroungigenitalium TaxID=1042321 RepID=UPI0021E823D5|nr:lipoprotein 17-related variable surface protein [Ureaplasma miroungigenitalium]MCV3734466.1 lipoprotein 17-related variable surface protein [Ureaplasma miroungigenitalium]
MKNKKLWFSLSSLVVLATLTSAVAVSCKNEKKELDKPNNKDNEITIDPKQTNPDHKEEVSSVEFEKNLSGTIYTLLIKKDQTITKKERLVKQFLIWLTPTELALLEHNPYIRLYTNKRQASILTHITSDKIKTRNDRKYLLIDFEFPKEVIDEVTNLKLSYLGFVKTTHNAGQLTVEDEKVYLINNQGYDINVIPTTVDQPISDADQLLIYDRDINQYVHLRQTNILPSKFTNNNLLIDFHNPSIKIIDQKLTAANNIEGSIVLTLNLTLNDQKHTIEYKITNLQTTHNDSFIMLDNQKVHANEYIKNPAIKFTKNASNQLLVPIEINNFYDGSIDLFIKKTQADLKLSAPVDVILVIRDENNQEYFSQPKPVKRFGQIDFVFDDIVYDLNKQYTIVAMDVIFNGHKTTHEPYRMECEPAIILHSN